MQLKPFQRQFEAAVENDAYDTVVLSGPRTLGKTFIAARILTRCMTPGDSLFQPGKEYILGSASLEMGRLTYGFIREALDDGSKRYRFLDSATRLGITHVSSNTKLRAISSNAKTSFGLVNVPLVVIDEPGALDLLNGRMLSDSLFTAQGKVGSRLKLVLIGTLAPLATDAGHWWFDLVKDGTKGRVHVQHFAGTAETWDKWPTIRKANPLIGLDPHTRKVILEERDSARSDPRLKARFLSYRLNIPSRDDSEMLITVDDWEQIKSRKVCEPEGAPIVAVDLGSSRSWSAACAVFPSGLIDAIAVAPGEPTLSTQEVRDRVNPGTYLRLEEAGQLLLADGLRVAPPGLLWDAILERWGRPKQIICDRFRLAELQDVVKGRTKIEDRVTRWSHAAFDIRSLRKFAKDGPFMATSECRALIEASLSVAYVKNDDQGNVRLSKRGTQNAARDDVAAALVLAAGAYARKPKPATLRSLGLAG